MKIKNSGMGMRKWLSFLFVLISLQVSAQILNPVKWTYSSRQVSPGVYDLLLKATMDANWHVYSQHIGDGGPVPTSFSFKKDDAAYTFIGDVKEKGKAIKIHDPSFDNMLVIYYKKEVTFVQRVKVLKPVKSIEGSLEFMTCDDTKCQAPETKNFSIELKADKTPVKDQGSAAPKENDKADAGKTNATQTKQTVAAAADAIKWSVETRSAKDKQFTLVLKGNIASGYYLDAADDQKASGCMAPVFTFTPEDSVKPVGNLIADSKPKKITQADGSSYMAYDSTAVFEQKVEYAGHSPVINGKVSFSLCSAGGCVPAQVSSFTIDVPAAETAGAPKKQALSSVFWICFLGGIAALLTPCVFPMIPLTVSFFTKQSEKKAKGVSNALLFGLSIMVIYVGLGLLITVSFGPNALNDLASNVYTNLAFFLIFSIFAFSFLGAFDITLPSSWANKSDARAERGGIIGIFFIALTLTIVSFSCTSLVIGNLLIFAAKGGGYTGPTVGMLGFSLAWAIPFTLFAMFPSLMQKLPKSGGWLNAVKVTLGFIELALALKFLSTADLTYHWGLLKREYFLALWIVIFGMLGFYLLGKIKLSHDTPVAHLSVTRLMLALLALAFTLYMLPGLWGAPLELLSGIAPPSGYSEWVHDDSPAPRGNTAIATEKPHKYKDLFHATKTHGIDIYYDYDEALAAAKAAKKPLMVDFTGWSCSNCRRMEDNVWSSPQVLPVLKNDYILVSLYVDEKHDLADNEVYVSKYSGDKITTLGDKWKDMQASRYGANSQPFYVLLDNNENKIGQYGSYDPDISKFLGFLNNGLARFKSSQTSSAN